MPDIFKKLPRDIKPRLFFNDTLFTYLFGYREVFQEFVQIVLERRVEIVESGSQVSVANPGARCARLDALCKFADGARANVELQNANDVDHMRRVRFYASLITAAKTPEGADFTDVPDVYSIYVMDFNFFKKRCSRFVIKRKLANFEGRELNVPSELLFNGHTEIFINAKRDDGSPVSAFLKMMKDKKVFDQQFEAFCDVKNRLLFTEEGEDMIAYLNEHDTKVRKEGFEQGLEQGLEQGGVKERGALTALKDVLVPRGRESDVLRAISDLPFRAQLIAEFFPSGLPTK